MTLSQPNFTHVFKAGEHFYVRLYVNVLFNPLP